MFVESNPSPVKYAAKILNFNLTIATPSGFEPDKSTLSLASDNVELCDLPGKAVEDCDLVTTDLDDELIYRDKFYFPVPPLKIIQGQFYTYIKSILLSTIMNITHTML